MLAPRSRQGWLYLLLLPLLAVAVARAQSGSGSDAPVPSPFERSTKIAGSRGVQLAVYESGRAGAPPIIFIHGFSQNALTWERQFASDLSASHHLVAFDLRGHGASDKPLDPEQYTAASAWTEDLAAVIQQLGLQRPILVGWSYGGWIIADYLRRHGDAQLGGLVFVGASAKLGGDAGAALMTPEALGIFGDVLAPEPRKSLVGTRALVDLFASRGSAEWEVAFGSAMMVPPSVRLAMFSRTSDNADVLSTVRIPTLVIHGANDRILRPAAGREIATRVPGARLLLYDEVGHAPHLDSAARFARDLAEFVKSARAERVK